MNLPNYQYLIHNLLRMYSSDKMAKFVLLFKYPSNNIQFRDNSKFHLIIFLKIPAKFEMLTQHGMTSVKCWFKLTRQLNSNLVFITV